MNIAPVAPLVASLQRTDPVDAQRARLLFSEPLARLLGRWVPGVALSQPPRRTSAVAQDGSARLGVLLRGELAELRLTLPASIDAVVESILAAGAWSPALRLRCLCLHASSVLAPLMDWMEAIGLHPLEVEADPQPLPSMADSTSFECRLGAHRIEGSLRCSDPAWLAHASKAIAMLAPASCLPARRLPMGLRARLGTRRMTARLLRSIEVGDVVLLDGLTKRADRPSDCLVLFGNLRGRCAAGRTGAVRGHEITILGECWMNTETTSRLAPGEQDAREGVAGADGEAPDPLADVEVDLHFELQVLATPLGELAAMRPGYVIELPVPAAEACVSLVVGGQVYGRAQLVSLGDRLGARIIELFHAD